MRIWRDTSFILTTPSRRGRSCIISYALVTRGGYPVSWRLAASVFTGTGRDGEVGTQGLVLADLIFIVISVITRKQEKPKPLYPSCLPGKSMYTHPVLQNSPADAKKSTRKQKNYNPLYRRRDEDDKCKNTRQKSINKTRGRETRGDEKCRADTSTEGCRWECKRRVERAWPRRNVSAPELGRSSSWPSVTNCHIFFSFFSPLLFLLLSFRKFSGDFVCLFAVSPCSFSSLSIQTPQGHRASVHGHVPIHANRS